jgi:DNA polymerase I-like protein with 3'-5' exonuclease and polymerase domains
MWWTMKAMIRVQEFFDRLNDGGKFHKKTWPGGYHLVLQVHDELVVDFPRGSSPGYNKPIAREVQRLMALGGDDFGIPTPVGCEYHPNNWAEGE